MAHVFTSVPFERVLVALVEGALSRDVPQEIAEEARAAAARAVITPSAKLTRRDRRRVEAYFSAVVRHKVARSASSPRAVARCVAASVVADLRSAGRSGGDIWDELQRGWATRIPGDVLEEYRLRLCG